MAKSIQDHLSLTLKKIFGKPSLPDFFILGAQKAGTSSLHSYLNYHPQLKGVYPKELHFFDHPEKVENNLEDYKKIFTRPFWDSRLYYESTPNYLFHTEIAHILKELKPDLKFIVLQREPIARAYSAWNMFKNNYEKQLEEKQEIQPHLLKYLRGQSFMTFEEVVAMELEEIKKKDSDSTSQFNLLRKGQYKQQLEKWYQHFPKERFYINDFENFTRDPLVVLNEISEFLEVQNFDKVSLDLKPRNQREYTKVFDENIRSELEQFYYE